MSNEIFVNNKFLVICTKTVVENWIREKKKWTNLLGRVFRFNDGQSVNIKAKITSDWASFERPAFLIVSYDTFRSLCSDKTFERHPKIRKQLYEVADVVSKIIKKFAVFC